jgi:hypothetical protein
LTASGKLKLNATTADALNVGPGNTFVVNTLEGLVAVNGKFLIDGTNTDQCIIRKGGGGSTVFKVDTLNSYVDSRAQTNIQINNIEALGVRSAAGNPTLIVDTTNSRVRFIDSNFYNAIDGVNPFINFDNGDIIRYDRTNSEFQFRHANSTSFLIGSNVALCPLEFRIERTGSNPFSVANSGQTVFFRVDTQIPRVTSCSILPITTETYDLGSASFEWLNIYSQNAVTVSDRNKKSDIIPETLGLYFINDLEPSSYIYKSNKAPSRGLIAQDLEILCEKYGIKGLVRKVEKEDCSKEYDYGIEYNQLFSILIKSIQELSEKVKKLEEK